MILWDRIKRSLDNGFEQVMKVSKILSERARIETQVAKLLIDKGSLETRQERAQKRLGERVHFLWEQKTDAVMADQEVMEALREIADLKEEIERIKLNVKKVSLGEEDI